MFLRKLLLASVIATLTGAAMADDGQTLYQDNCRKCHGADGTARTARGYLYFARDLTHPAWQARHSDDDIFHLISDGDGPGGWSAMPAYRKRLTDAERRALVQSVRAFGTTPAR